LNKVFLLGIILVLLTVFCGGAIAGTSSISGLDLNVENTNSLAGINATITYSNSADLNALCFNTSDTNTASACITTNSAITSIDLNSDIIAGITSNTTEGDYNLFVFAKADDGNYDASNSAPFTIDTSVPTLSATSPSSSSDNNTANFTIDLNVTDTYTGVLCSDAVVKLDGVTKSISCTEITDGNKLSFSVTDLNTATHTVTLDVNDEVANNLSTSFSFNVDVNAPVLADANAANRTTWTNDEEPDFVINATDNNSAMSSGTAAFSCATGGTFQSIAFTSTTISTFNITSTGYDCNTADGNTLVYVQVKDASGNWSNKVSTNVLYDNTNPSAPSGLGGVGNDGSVYLSWTATGTADNLSGNAGYQIFVNDTLNSTTTDVSKTISGLTNGTSYSFKVRTYDNAGNVSGFTSSVSVTSGASGTGTGTGTGTSNLTAEATIKRDGTAIEYVKDGDTIEISCSYSVEADGTKIYYKYYNPNTTQELLKGPTNDVSTLSETLDIDGSSEKLGAWCYGATSDDTATSTIKYVFLDNTKPSISWKSSSTTFVGTVNLEANASDDKKLKKVEFEIDGIKYGTTKDGNNYSFSLDTLDLDNKTYAIKAIATDDAGNVKEITKTITVENIVTPKQEKENALSVAISKKKVVEDLIEYLEEEGVLISKEIKDKKTVADNLLKDANNLTDIDAIKAKAAEAVAKYDEINLELPLEVEVISSDEYEFEVDDIVELLIALGIDQASAEEAKAILEKTNTKRTIEILKVGDSYQAKIKITLVNDTDNTTIKIVEVVPKDFAESAALLHSSHPFIIIEDDPIIEFTIEAPIGSEIEVSYGIANLSEDEANAILDNNVIASFAAPPIVTGNETTIGDTLGANDNGFGFLLMIIVVVIILLVIAGAGSFIFMQYNKNSTPSFGNTKNEGIKNKLKGKLKKDNGNAPNKWKYKG
jgi:hypothetical protein